MLPALPLLESRTRCSGRPPLAYVTHRAYTLLTHACARAHTHTAVAGLEVAESACIIATAHTPMQTSTQTSEQANKQALSETNGASSPHSTTTTRSSAAVGNKRPPPLTPPPEAVQLSFLSSLPNELFAVFRRGDEWDEGGYDLILVMRPASGDAAPGGEAATFVSQLAQVAEAIDTPALQVGG